MVNTGKWNSDLALIFVMMFFSPIVLFFFAGFIVRIMQMFEKTYVVNVYQPAKTKTDTKKTITEHKVAKQSKPATKSKPKKVNKVKKKSDVRKYLEPQKHGWDNSVVSDAIIGLKGLGYKTSDARRIASKIYATNQNMTAENIIIAAMNKSY